MKVQKTESGVTLVLEGEEELELLRLALKRATFEDTPPERQHAIADFSMALLKSLGG